MNTLFIITSELDEMELGYIATDVNNDFDWVEITETTLEESAKALGLSNEAMYVIWHLFDDIKTKVGEDLQDIWGRLDNLEERVRAIGDKQISPKAR